SWWNGRPFDRVLLDAPCSASGVIRRHPDIKHLRRPADLEALAGLQSELLQAGWRVLERGGRLLYVTCSVFRRENDAVVGAFLSRNPDARENNLLPNNNIHALMKRTSHGFQILPGTEDLDGFFYACLDKQP
ncbi:MAG: 16S rRNA (cytosine(967)-C(5))-methyltransferase RsmB, partial [Woeseiaceae bacterium]|nr:16S rRNA (cytosine(967)-C(5))-methyltransferase RsmB [Woeseiaceae bacterium]